MTTSNRGTFKLSGEFFRGIRAGEGVNVFHNMIVLRAEQAWDGDYIRYMAIHPDFLPVTEGCVTPEYVGTIPDGEIYPKWAQV